MTWEELIEGLEAVRKRPVCRRDEARPINLPARKIKALERVHYTQAAAVESTTAKGYIPSVAMATNHLSRFLAWMANISHYRGNVKPAASCAHRHARTHTVNKCHLRHVFCLF